MSQEYRLGIVGDGQLGRMQASAAITKFGFEVTVLGNPAKGQRSPAAQVGAHQLIGGLKDEAAILELAKGSGVVTIEVEHVNAVALQKVKDQGVEVFPNPLVLATIQDKFQQKQMLMEAGFPVVLCHPIENGEDPKSLYEAGEFLGYPFLLKTRREGYDGRGNFMVLSEHEIPKIPHTFLRQSLYAEEYFGYNKELAVTVARARTGVVGSEHPAIVTYPVVETIHRDGICDMVIAPAPVDLVTQMEAERLAMEYSDKFGSAGVDTIEMFLGRDGELVINEIAPRIHNSGHFSLDACETSHAENHVRGVMGLPLGPVKMLCRSAVMVNILSEDPNPVSFPEAVRKALAVSPEVNIHLYGKTPDFKRRRKVGHITVLEVDFEDTLYVARVARDAMQI